MALLPISVCYLVKNEADFLESSLQSVVSFASEIIVVDTGSTDSTIQIAKKYTDQIHHFDWINDFSAARNFAASFAKSEWILFVDGDEVLEKQAEEKLRFLIQNQNVQAYSILQRNYGSARNITGWVHYSKSTDIQSILPDNHFEGYVDNLMYKLYRNNRDISWSGLVHETIIHSCRKLNLKWKESDLIFHHLAEAKTPAFKDKKKNYYLRLALKKLNEDPDHENPWFELGISFCNINRWSEAERAFAEAIKRRPDWLEARLMRAQTLLQLDRFEEAESLLRGLLETSFHFEDVLAHLSTALLYQKKFEECLKVIEAGESIGLNHPHFHINAATLLFELKEYPRCHRHLEQAKEIVPNDSFVHESLAKVSKFISFA